MTKKPENPPAFPVSSIDGFTQHGLSLRDYFAGQALAGICANAAYGEATSPEMADDAYRLADAMLEARAKREPSP